MSNFGYGDIEEEDWDTESVAIWLGDDIRDKYQLGLEGFNSEGNLTDDNKIEIDLAYGNAQVTLTREEVVDFIWQLAIALGNADSQTLEAQALMIEQDGLPIPERESQFADGLDLCQGQLDPEEEAEIDRLIQEQIAADAAELEGQTNE